MDKFDNLISLYKKNIVLIMKVIMIGCQNSKFCYIEREKPNVNKIKSPYDSMGKKLHI